MKLLAVCILLSIIAIGDAGWIPKFWKWIRGDRSPYMPLQDPEKVDDTQRPLPAGTPPEQAVKKTHFDAHVYAYRKITQWSIDVMKDFYAIATFISPTVAITVYNAQYTTEGWILRISLPSGTGITSYDITTQHVTKSILLLTIPASLAENTKMNMVIYKEPEENYVLPDYGYIVGSNKDIKCQIITEQESNDTSNPLQESSFYIVPMDRKSGNTSVAFETPAIGKALELNEVLYGLYLGVDETSNTRHKFLKIPGQVIPSTRHYIQVPKKVKAINESVKLK